MNDRIAILGCGWLGKPLARTLLRNGWEVRGSTTSPERLGTLKEMGIDAYLVDIRPGVVQGDIDGLLQDVDVLFINIPPGLRKSGQGDFTGKIAALIPYLEKHRPSQLIFISSTSVYGNAEGSIDEDHDPEPVTESGRQLLEAEHLVKKLEIPTMIIRFGGLLGPDRHPLKYLSGRENLSDGGAPVNLIQLEDAVCIPIFLLGTRPMQGVFNAVAPEHPSKKEYYSKMAEQRSMPPPSYRSGEDGTGMKVVASKNLHELGYKFRSSIYDEGSYP